MKLLGKYINGNYTVKIYDDGTKVRETEYDDFIATFPETFDCKITNQCDMGCQMCHEKSTPDGKHGDILSPKFLDTLKPYTEIAIGGGNPLSHPNLIEFLQKIKEKKVFANMTVNQHHFMKSLDTIKYLVDNRLIWGLGVSLLSSTDEFIQTVKQFPNCVIHIINGIVNKEQLAALSDNDLKILILGYKYFGRGIDNYSKHLQEIIKNQQYLKENLPFIINKFRVVSFDNLAIEQLDVRRLMSDRDWDEFYMGDDGTKTMYIDLVEQKFARCSVAEARYDLLDSIDDMFYVILNENMEDM